MMEGEPTGAGGGEERKRRKTSGVAGEEEEEKEEEGPTGRQRPPDRPSVSSFSHGIRLLSP